MAFYQCVLRSGKAPINVEPPKDTMLTLRSAVLIGEDPCSLYVTTRDYLGKSNPSICLGHLNAVTSRIRLDMPFGFGEPLKLSVVPKNSNSTKSVVHIAGFLTPTKMLMDDEDEDEEGEDDEVGESTDGDSGSSNSSAVEVRSSDMTCLACRACQHRSMLVAAIIAHETGSCSVHCCGCCFDC